MKTKTVINKKIYDNYLKYNVTTDTKPNVILGSWIINHKFKSKKNNEDLEIKGEYEINIWYSYDDNTKTDVVTRKIEYNEIVPKIFDDTSTYCIKGLGNPSCNKVNIENNTIIVEIFKQFEIEVIDEVKILEDKPEKIEKITIYTSGIMGFDDVENITTELKNKINKVIEKLNYLLE